MLHNRWQHPHVLWDCSSRDLLSKKWKVVKYYFISRCSWLSPKVSSVRNVSLYQKVSMLTRDYPSKERDPFSKENDYHFITTFQWERMEWVTVKSSVQGRKAWQPVDAKTCTRAKHWDNVLFAKGGTQVDSLLFIKIHSHCWRSICWKNQQVNII